MKQLLMILIISTTLFSGTCFGGGDNFNINNKDHQMLIVIGAGTSYVVRDIYKRLKLSDSAATIATILTVVGASLALDAGGRDQIVNPGSQIALTGGAIAGITLHGFLD